MNNFCVNKWNANKDYLRETFMKMDELEYSLFYHDLMNLVVKCILNRGQNKMERYNEKTVEINLGSGYEGDLLFVILPEQDWGGTDAVLVSSIGYGSCALCDTLEGIWESKGNKKQKVDDLMNLCKTLTCNIVKPYNEGWHNDARFD